MLIRIPIAVGTALGVRAGFGNENPLFQQANANRRRCCREKNPEAGQQKDCNYLSHEHELPRMGDRVKASYSVIMISMLTGAGVFGMLAGRAIRKIQGELGGDCLFTFLGTDLQNHG